MNAGYSVKLNDTAVVRQPSKTALHLLALLLYPFLFLFSLVAALASFAKKTKVLRVMIVIGCVIAFLCVAAAFEAGALSFTRAGIASLALAAVEFLMLKS